MIDETLLQQGKLLRFCFPDAVQRAAVHR